MALDSLRTLGRSGLVVSPLALGTMTFGNSGFGSTEIEATEVFDAYLDAGGNFIDTADVYSGGQSEVFLGKLIAERGVRDDVVLASKAGFNGSGKILRGGNGRKHLMAALDASLKRLGTDYLDLYWIHVWDSVTPAAELLETLVQLQRSGKARYVGLSNLPAWYATQISMLGQQHGQPGPIALQLEYSLVARGIEHEHLPAARSLGLGIVPWSPLAGGFLSGKYARGEGRIQIPDTGDAARLLGSNPFGQTKFSEHNWAVLAELRAVAEALDASPAQVALAWLLAKGAVSSVLIGARTSAQLSANFKAQKIQLSLAHVARLDAASESNPYVGLTTPALRSLQPMLFGGHYVAQVK